MAIVRRRYTKTTVNDTILQAFVSPTATVVADYGNVIDIEVDDVDGEGDTLDEYMAGIGSSPGGNSTKPTFAYATDVDLYVNASTGSDVNPGTITQPFATLDRALRAVPSEWISFCRIWIAAGTYMVTDELYTSGIRNDYLGTPMGVNAKPMSWNGEFTDISGTLVAVAGSSTTQVVVAGPLTPDDYLGATALVLTGAAAGTRIQIRGNTATDILFINAANNAIGIGDTFRVERPAVILKMNGPVSLWGIYGQMAGTAGLNLKGIKFELDGNELLLSGIAVGCCGVEFTHAGGIVYLEGAKLHTQPYYSDPQLQSVDEFYAGIYFNNASGPGVYNVGLFEDSFLYDTTVFNGCSVLVDSGDLSIVGIEAVNSYLWMAGPANFRIVDGSVRGRFRDVVPAFGMIAAINIIQGTGQAIRGIDFGNVTGHAVACVDMGTTNLQDLGNLAATTVTGFGVFLSGMSRARIDGGVVVTGTLGDTSVGGTVTAYGAVPFYSANLCGIE